MVKEAGRQGTVEGSACDLLEYKLNAYIFMKLRFVESLILSLIRPDQSQTSKFGFLSSSVVNWEKVISGVRYMRDKYPTFRCIVLTYSSQVSILYTWQDH